MNLSLHPISRAVARLIAPVALLMSGTAYADLPRVGGSVGQVWERSAKPVLKPVAKVAARGINLLSTAMAGAGSGPTTGADKPNGDRDVELKGKPKKSASKPKSTGKDDPRDTPDDKRDKIITENLNRSMLNQQPVRPPYETTPFGQPLRPSAPMTPNVPVTPTKNSPAGGGPGYTRSGGQQLHAGVDHAPPGKAPSVSSEPVTYSRGAGVGRVTKVADSKEFGKQINIESKTPSGTYETKFLHLHKVDVNKDDVVFPGQRVGSGAGNGDQFKSKKAGPPHVHQEVRRDGQPINPITGEPLDKRPPKR